MTQRTLHLATPSEANTFLAEDPLGLLTGLSLDQGIAAGAAAPHRKAGSGMLGC